MRKSKMIVYFIPFTNDPDIDTISTRIPLLYAALKEYAEVVKAPPSVNSKNFIINRLLLLVKTAKSIFQIPKLKPRMKTLIIIGSDQPSGFVAAILGEFMKHLWRSRTIFVVYDSHGSRYKLANDLNPPFIYKIISVFEDAFSIRNSDKVIVPTYADMAIYHHYVCKKDKFMLLPSFVRINNVIFNEWSKRELDFAFHANFNYPPNIDAIKIISIFLATKNNLKFVIFGVNSENACKHLPPEIFKQNNVECLGYITNPYQILGNTKIYLAPIFKGTGIITKVLEAMVAGAIPITTKFVSLGIPELRRWPELIAENPNDWIVKVENHLTGKYKLNYEDISRKLAEIVKHKYSYEKNKLILENIYKKVKTDVVMEKN